MDREGIGSERGIGSEKRFGVGVVGCPDVSPFCVHDDQEPHAARSGDQPLQGAKPTPPVTLVEGRLEFDKTDRPRCCAERYVGEAIQPLWRVPDSPRIQDRTRGVQSPGQRSVLGSHGREAGGERISHRAILADRLRQITSGEPVPALTQRLGERPS